MCDLLLSSELNSPINDETTVTIPVTFDCGEQSDMGENDINFECSHSGDSAGDAALNSHFTGGSTSEPDRGSRWELFEPSTPMTASPRILLISSSADEANVAENGVQETNELPSDANKKGPDNPDQVPANNLKLPSEEVRLSHNITSSPNLQNPILSNDRRTQRRLSESVLFRENTLDLNRCVTSPTSCTSSVSSGRPSTKRFPSLYYSLAPSYKSKLEQFRRIFLGTPVDTDRLLVDYSCALSKNNHGLLLQGRMYVTENWVCFYSKILQEQKIYLSVKEVISITKEKTARVIPNAIQLVYSRSHQRFFFTSFASRERTYAILRKVWENCRNHQSLLQSNQSMSIDEIVQQVREIYGDDSLATLDDEDSEIGAHTTPVVPHSQSTSDSTDDNLVSDDTHNDLSHVATDALSARVPEGSTVQSSDRTTEDEDSAKLQTEHPDSHQPSSIPDVVQHHKLGQKHRLLQTPEPLPDMSEPDRNGTDTYSAGQLSVSDERKTRSKKRQKRSPSHREPNIAGSSPPGLLAFPELSPPDNDSATCFPGHDHPGKPYVNTLIPLSVDALFACIFTDSEFFDRLSVSRGTFNMVQSSWPSIQWPSTEYKASDPAITVERVIGYTLSLKQKFGPRTCAAVEHQTLLVSESRPKQCYVVDAKVVNQAVALCNCFCVVSRYCLLRAGPLSSRLCVYSRVVYEKPVFFGAKSIIESTCATGLTDFFTALTAQLTDMASSLSDDDRLTGGLLSAPCTNAAVTHNDSAAAKLREKKSRGRRDVNGDQPNDAMDVNKRSPLGLAPKSDKTVNALSRNSSPYHKSLPQDTGVFGGPSVTEFTLGTHLLALKDVTCFFLRPDRAWLLLCFISLLLCLCLSLVYNRLVALELLAEQLSKSAASNLAIHSVQSTSPPASHLHAVDEESHSKFRVMKELVVNMSETLSQMQQILVNVQSTLDRFDAASHTSQSTTGTPVSPSFYAHRDYTTDSPPA